jgi:hypothetical protein
MRTHTVGGTTLSLQDIWMEKLIPLLSDQSPSSLFLLSNGAVGDPPLNKEVVTSANLAQLSEQAASAFIADPNNVRLDTQMKVVRLSPFFQWHREILSKQYPDMSNFIATYLDDPSRSIFLNSVVPKNYSQNFNWRLNALSSPKER